IRSFENPPEKVKSSLPGHFPSIWGNVGGKNDIAKELFIKDAIPKELKEAFEKIQLSQEVKQSNGLDRHVPHVLFDGADSVGAWGSLSRVYLNIGTYSERWITLHNPLIGFRTQRPFSLRDAPGGRALVKGIGVPWAPELAAGRRVFAQHCIVCHSSKQPKTFDA